MNESEHNRLSKRLRALLLGNRDMEQASLAAETIETEDDCRIVRLLETAMVVCYMRPFTPSKLVRLDEYVPTEEPDRSLHKLLKTLRNKVYAHTDVMADRGVGFSLGHKSSEETDWIPWGEFYRPIAGDVLDAVIDLCRRLGKEMYREARRVHIQLDQPEEWFGPGGPEHRSHPDR